MDEYVAAAKAQEAGAERNRFFAVVASMQIHRELAVLCLHDDPASPAVDNDGRVPAIAGSMKSMPGFAEVAVAIFNRHARQIRAAQRSGFVGVQVNAMKGAIRGQNQQMPVRRLNDAGIQDRMAIPLEGSQRKQAPVCRMDRGFRDEQQSDLLVAGVQELEPRPQSPILAGTTKAERTMRLVPRFEGATPHVLLLQASSAPTQFASDWVPTFETA
jgi:hypothetical protein